MLSKKWTSPTHLSKSISRILSSPYGPRLSLVWDERYRSPRAAYPRASWASCTPLRESSLFGLASNGVYLASLLPDLLVSCYLTV